MKNQITVSTVQNWLVNFKETNYNNRPLTDQFWSIGQIGINLGIDVKSILGSDIMSYLKKTKPNPFEVNSILINEDEKSKKILIDFHLN
jgi:hypothetical protein